MYESGGWPTSDPTPNLGAPCLALETCDENDSFGNMLSDGSFSVSYMANNQTSVTPYDTAGNQRCSTDQYGGISQYSYDAGNRISQINGLNSSSPFVSYVYGADGARARATPTEPIPNMSTSTASRLPRRQAIRILRPAVFGSTTSTSTRTARRSPESRLRTRIFT